MLYFCTKSDCRVSTNWIHEKKKQALQHAYITFKAFSVITMFIDMNENSFAPDAWHSSTDSVVDV